MRPDLLAAATDSAFKRIPSPLKATLVGAGAGALIGLLAGNPVKYGVIGAGITFLGAVALESAYMSGVGVGCHACSTERTKRVVETAPSVTQTSGPSEARRTRMPSPFSFSARPTAAQPA